MASANLATAAQLTSELRRHLNAFTVHAFKYLPLTPQVMPPWQHTSVSEVKAIHPIALTTDSLAPVCLAHKLLSQTKRTPEKMWQSMVTP